MTVLTEASRDFWRTELLSGSFAPIPRWCPDQAPGVAEHLLALTDDLGSALSRLAEDLGLELSAVLLAAHAAVLSALTGEPELTTGYRPTPAAAPLPCRLTTRPRTWRELLLTTGRAESQLLAHSAFPVAALRRELGLTEAAFDVVLDPYDEVGPDVAALTDGVVLAVGMVERGGRLTLRLRYRTDALDADSARRIAGYHRHALALAAADPDAPHGPQCLLAADELELQLEGFAGPHRELPDRRGHELFEDRARVHPDAVAAQLGDRELTYAELNARANRLARALRARGVGREDVVAVVTERNLGWLTAVLAVFKAGGVYLPVEPHFPPDRVATMLARAGCRLVVTEPGSRAALDGAKAAVPGLETLLVSTGEEEGHPDDDLGVAVGAGQLAYIYFTSGSTGEPKGAMCEHAGLLNHLFAKIDDLEIGAGDVVAQTAPQCFDISLWQLVSGLLVGARTLLVEQQVVLDVERFVDTLVAGRVNVLQVVPSYLEAVLSYLERDPRLLPDLRYVSVTGEALKKELAQRWFDAQPGIRLVNAYGLTETSDDTNHEVMDRVPEGDRVPLGRPVNNVRVYVVDDHLNPVPLGAPGAIVFSGVCVGRGYVNDPERTRLAFLSDPHRPGQRLYQAGDFGRWLPGGKLDFLGRRDSQVKISGFRIEIGEIDNALLQIPGVRDAAVVVAERAGRGKHLVAYYAAAGPVEVDTLRRRLAGSLPAYLVPAVFCWLPRLPLTANSKIDRRALAALAAAAASEEPTDPLRTAAERQVAAGWSQVLGLPLDQIGRQDHFFDHGGSSLAAVKLAIALDRRVSLREVTRHPVLSDLAALLEARTSDPSSSASS